jgi:hypothetical protein
MDKECTYIEFDEVLGTEASWACNSCSNQEEMSNTYGTWTFIVVFTTARHWTRRIQSTLSHPIQLKLFVTALHCNCTLNSLSAQRRRYAQKGIMFSFRSAPRVTLPINGIVGSCRANAELVPKFHVALHASHTALPMVTLNNFALMQPS